MLKFVKILSIYAVLTSAILAQDFESSGRDSIFTGEILVESNRIKMTKVLAPNKIQVFDERVILSLNGSRLPDVLEVSDALFIKDYGFNSGIKTIALNSTQSEHTLVLIDGIRLNSRQNAQVDLSLYNLDNVSRIEISKGGSSALYGSEAIGGVINIITKDITTVKQFGLNFKVSLGSYGYRKFHGAFSHGIDLKHNKNIAYSLSFSDERAENKYKYEFGSGSNSYIRERTNADFNTQSINFDINYQAGNRSAFRLFSNYSYFERGSPGIDLGYTTGIARQLDYNSISSLSYIYSGRKVSFKTDILYNYALQKYFDPATFNMSSKIDSYYKLNSIGGTASLTYTPSVHFDLQSGAEISSNNIESNETEKGKRVQGALFSAAKFEINTGMVSKVTFYPSLRYDHFSNISRKNVLTGKLGVNIKPFAENELSFKSSIGNNFSAPTFNELYWKDLGNKDLKPERSVSFDAGLFYKFTLFAVNEIEFSYFNINTVDRIVWTPVSGIWKPLNIGKVRSEGIDVSLRSGITFQKNITSSLNLSYSYGTALKKNEDFHGDLSYNKQLIYLPKEMVKASFMFNYLTTTNLLKSVSFNLFYRFTTRRYINFENTEFSPRFDVFDANFGFGFRVFESEANLRFIVNNILNENYQPVPGYPMPLRNYRIELGFKY